MKKVSELEYTRLPIEDFGKEAMAIIEQVKNAASAQEVLAARDKCNDLIIRWETAEALSYMRYSINTADAFYLAEKEYYDEVGPQAQNYLLEYTKAMLATPFRKELEEQGEIIPLVFRSFEVELKAMSPEIIEDMIAENQVVSQYSQMMAGMEFEFRGEKLPRPMLMKYAKSPDRATRKEAYEVLGKTLKAHSEQLDGLFDQLVHIRDRMAKKMGYRNFVELGYYRMGRLCYGPEEVKQFRENVRRDIVPVVARLRKEIGEKLGVEPLMLYDYDLIFPQGDPAPKGGKEEIFAAARAMYHDMSEETGKFIDFMLETEAFDVDSRKNKWGGGYCTHFPAYHQPFILANFNGTAGDVEMLVMETLAELAENGIPAAAVEAAVNSVEFDLRENNSGRFPRGLAAMIRSLATWLYDGDPIAPLAWEKPLAALKARLASGEKVFEGAIRRWFLDNEHRSTVILTPDSDSGAPTEDGAIKPIVYSVSRRVKALVQDGESFFAALQ